MKITISKKNRKKIKECERWRNLERDREREGALGAEICASGQWKLTPGWHSY